MAYFGIKKKKQKQKFYLIKFQGFLEKGKGLYATENTTLEFYWVRGSEVHEGS